MIPPFFSQLSITSVDFSSNNIEEDDNISTTFVRLVVESPEIKDLDFADNSVHADVIATLCKINTQATGSPCHCLCEKLGIV